MEIYIPYKNAEEKQLIVDSNTDKEFLRDAMVGSKRFLVYDDAVEPPFTIPDETTKHGFLTLLDYINNGITGKTPAEFLADIKARLQ